MDIHFEQVASQSKISCTLTSFLMHQFTGKKKNKVAQGNCLILQWFKQEETNSLTYIKMNNFDYCKQINESIFVKVRYLTSTSFLFFHQFNNNVIYAVSSLNTSPDLNKFEESLKLKGNVLDYLSPNLKPQIKSKIDQHFDNILQEEIIITFTKTTKYAKIVGGFFGKLSKTITQNTSKAEEKFQSKVQKFSRESFSQQTRSKWDKFKAKVSQINEKMTDLIKPINESVNKVVTDLGENYNNSTNTYVKVVRDFTKQAQNSINEGYKTEEPPIVNESNLIDDNSKQMMGQHLILNEQNTANPYPQL